MVLIGLLSRPYYLTMTGKHEGLRFNSHIYNNLKKAKSVSDTTDILVIGDSVGNQLFGELTEASNVTALTGTSAMSILGQYILLAEFLERNKPRVVVMINTPSSYRNDIVNLKTSYHSILKPFYRKEYMHHFSDLALGKIRQLPFWWFSQNPLMIASPWGPPFGIQKEVNHEFFSPLSAEYVNKISKLCEDKDIELLILSPPLNYLIKDDIHSTFYLEVAHYGLEQLFDKYIDEARFYPFYMFSDRVHVRNPHRYVCRYKELIDRLSTISVEGIDCINRQQINVLPVDRSKYVTVKGPIGSMVTALNFKADLASNINKILLKHKIMGTARSATEDNEVDHTLRVFHKNLEQLLIKNRLVGPKYKRYSEYQDWLEILRNNYAITDEGFYN